MNQIHSQGKGFGMFCSSSDKMKYAYLKTWNLDDAKCIIDRKTYKFHYRLWKDLRKTVLMKEILKQLKDSRVASR